MSKLIENPSVIFKCHRLSEQEITAGQSLNQVQVQVIENLIAKIAEEKLYLPYTPDAPQQYLQQEAHLRGQLDVLNFVLQTSAESGRLLTLGNGN